MTTTNTSYGRGSFGEFDAVCPGSFVYGGNKPAFILNPEATPRDLMSWCAYESGQITCVAELATRCEDPADAVGVFWSVESRLRVLNAMLHHVVNLDTPSANHAQRTQAVNAA